MPANMTPKMIDMIASVPAAFFSLGFLKNGTAFEIASTPVREAEPLVKALSKRIKDTPGTTLPTCAVAL